MHTCRCWASIQATTTSFVRRDIDALISTLVSENPGSLSCLRTPELTPSSSVLGRLSLNHITILAGLSVLHMSGRTSRQRDTASDRVSMGTTMVSSATDHHVIDRCVLPAHQAARGGECAAGQGDRAGDSRCVYDHRTLDTSHSQLCAYRQLFVLRVEDAETMGGDWDEVLRNERINRTEHSSYLCVRFSHM